MNIRQTALALITGTALLTSPLQAGGPVIVSEDTTYDAEPAQKRNGWVIPVLLLLAVGVIASSGGGGGGTTDGGSTPDTCTKNGNGCD